MAHLSPRWLILLCLMASMASAETQLKVVANELTPLAWQTDGRAQGVVYDLVKATQTRLGIDYPTQFLPFKRGLYLTQTNPGYLFFPCLRTPERDAKFKWVGPILKSRGVLYQLANHPPVRTIEDLYALRQIGVLLGSSSDDYLSSLGLKNLRRSHSRDEALRLLDLQRVDGVVMVDTAFPSLMKKLLIPSERVTASPVKLYDADYYLAFSLSTPDEQIQQWQKALDWVLQEQGPSIFARYQLPIPAELSTKQPPPGHR